MFAGVAGDFSPLTIEAGTNGPRAAPPSLVLAMAVGLGTVDMPVPSVAEWEWLNWRFPRPVHAGDTIYARWILTQKRPPVGGAPSSIVVWRVDVHTADGAVVAEGEVGAKVRRNLDASRPRTVERAVEQPATTASRRRRGRRSRGNGAPAPEPAPVPVQPAAAAKPERTSSPSRRRRRRRPSGAGAAKDEDHAAGAPPGQETSAASAPPEPAPVASAGRKGIGGVLRRLRGT